MCSNRLKELRKKANLSQEEAAKFLGVSRRTYQNYETSPEKIRPGLFDFYCEKLNQLTRVDEEHGILTLDAIKEIVASILKDYDVKSCYLFGSYARGEAREQSDVDLLIDGSMTGLEFYGLVEELRESLCKKVDLLNIKQLMNNPELLSNILKEGIKLYD